MADKKEAITYLFANPVRVGFENIIAARAYEVKGQPKGEPRFDATFILEPESPDLKALQELCISVLKEQYPGKKIVARRLTQDELDDGGVVEVVVPWRDGTKEADKAKAKGKDQEFLRGKKSLFNAAEVFKGYAGSVSEVDPLAGDADDEL
jgi:hypothetical protein